MASSNGFWPQWSENKLFTVLVGILLVYTIVFMYEQITLKTREIATVGYGDQAAPTIAVSGTGEVSGSPDLRKVDLTVTANAASANAAQDAQSSKTSTLLAALKALAIDDKDIKTSNYSVYPTYDYDRSPAVIVGYEASQTLTVTMRDEKLVSSVLQVAGDNDVTSIGDVQLAIEDTTALEAQARVEAIAEAYAQAQAIASAMGATLGKPVTYYESTGGSYPMMYLSKDAYGMGGADVAAPTIPEGENDVTMTVNITYAIE